MPPESRPEVPTVGYGKELRRPELRRRTGGLPLGRVVARACVSIGRAKSRTRDISIRKRVKALKKSSELTSNSSKPTSASKPLMIGNSSCRRSPLLA